jgi:hypothetical protein
MSANPFENEPGFEGGGQKEKNYKKEQEQYCQKVLLRYIAIQKFY